MVGSDIELIQTFAAIEFADDAPDHLGRLGCQSLVKKHIQFVGGNTLQVDLGAHLLYLSSVPPCPRG
jgi:hypothetical protein